MTEVVWAGGRIRGAHEPIISASDHGFTVGDGLFETIAIRDGVPFALTRHLARLAYGLERLGLSPLDPGIVRGAIGDLLGTGQALTRVRVTVTSGVGPAGYARGDSGPTVVVTGATGRAPRECVAVRAPWKRNERSAVAGVKTTSAGEYAVIANYARGRGADEAILANTYGNLCEGASTNVFVERGGEIITPPLASGCLPGIMRGLALEWGARAGIPVRVGAPGELTLADLDEVIAGAAHLAVTSTVRRVQHVSALDGERVTPGRLLRELAAHVELQAERTPDPAPPRRR
ncbi:aminotransferase class IV [Demequina flava]|uniref:aminotransferase class IV n=1 Tax=Demequina flava TaxID=1095025 RepID=UPI000785DD83|nr:aminotransferase class IV [Demequina flava]